MSIDLVNLVHFKWIASLSIFASALLAGWHPLRERMQLNREAFPLSKAFASGIFLGAALIHMLNDATLSFNQLSIHYPLASLLAGSTFLFLLWLEHLGREFEHHEDYASPSVVKIATFMLCFHALFEGAALGVNPELATSVVLFAAIMAHKWAASFALAAHLSISTISRKHQKMLFGLFCVMTPIAIVVADVSTNHSSMPWFEPTCTALAAGTFLYIGTLHGLRNAVMIERCCDLRQFLFVICGFATMALLGAWV